MKILHKLAYCCPKHDTKITNGEVLNDSVILDTALGRFGRKMKTLRSLLKLVFVQNTKISNGEVLDDSVIRYMVLDRFWVKNDNFAYFV